MSKKDIRDSLTDDARGSGGGFVPGNAITPMVDLGGSARPENAVPARTNVTESLEYPAYNWAPSAFQRGQYNSEYADLIKAASDRIANWNYDPKNDVSYRAYAQQYMRNGANAYEDTLARQAARTGGVASSYAAAAAQQQYNNYMADLASKVPELEQLAYQKAMNNLNMYTGLDETAYNRWQNDEQMRYNDWARLQSAAQSAYNQRYNAELNRYKAANTEDNGATDTDNIVSILKGFKDGANAYEYLKNRGYDGETMDELLSLASYSPGDAYFAYNDKTKDREFSLMRETAINKLEKAPNPRDRRLTLDGLLQTGQIDRSTYEALYRRYMMDEDKL